MGKKNVMKFQKSGQNKQRRTESKQNSFYGHMKNIFI